MKLYDSLVAAAVRPDGDDVVHDLRGQALEFWEEDRGEARAVGFLVRGVAARFGDRVEVRRQRQLQWQGARPGKTGKTRQLQWTRQTRFVLWAGSGQAYAPGMSYGPKLP